MKKLHDIWEKLEGKITAIDKKRFIFLCVPYIIIFYLIEKSAWLYRYCQGKTVFERFWVMICNWELAFDNLFPSFYWKDLFIGILGAFLIRIFVYIKGKNAKKFRHGEEYGSARWGTPKDISPFIDPVFENNILLTQTERLTMNSSKSG